MAVLEEDEMAVPEEGINPYAVRLKVSDYVG